MKKAILALAIALGTLTAGAQQTLEQATDSVRQIYTRAQQGVADDQNEVGGWFYRGRHVPQNYETALQWWSRAAQQGNALAVGNMGLCYQTGHGIAADSTRAVQLYDRSIAAGNPALFQSLEAQANRGNLFAATYMAHCYKDGIGTRRNISKQIEYLTIAADKGSLASRTQLALLYYNKHDYVQAYTNFSIAANHGDINAIYFTGLMLVEGKGVGQNASEGVTYLMRAERRGHVRAIYRLGMCYLNGEGVVADAEQAAKYFGMAAGRNLAVAQWALAECYVKGTGVTRDFDLATYYFARTLNATGYSTKFSKYAADSIVGTPYDTYLKGRKAYADGNFAAAKDFFKELVRTDRAEGELWQGIVMADTRNPQANLNKGIKMIKKSAETNTVAKYIYAGYCENGTGMSRDHAKALELYTAAANAGYGPAQCTLGDLYFEGRGVERNFETAVRWYNAARQSGQLTAEAASRLAECYLEGLGSLPVDPDAAAKLRQANYTANETALLNLI